MSTSASTKMKRVRDAHLQSGNWIWVKAARKQYESRLILEHVEDLQYVVLTHAGEVIRENYADAGIVDVIIGEEVEMLPRAAQGRAAPFEERPTQEQFDQVCTLADEMIDDLASMLKKRSAKSMTED